jgi:hypothetical protein
MLWSYYANILKTFSELVSTDRYRQKFYKKLEKVTTHASRVYEFTEKEELALNKSIEAFKA